MNNFYCRLALVSLIALELCSCGSSRKVRHAATNLKTLHYLGEYRLPFDFPYNNTVVGGLSGIDYDQKNDTYYLISDDRSDKNPARFYTAKIRMGNSGIDTFYFTAVENLLQANGQTYPGKKQDKFKVPDPEAIRYDPRTRTLAWSSEGERIVSKGDTVLVHPAINRVLKNGSFLDHFYLPDNLQMQVVPKGPRKNSVLEGMSFADDYKNLYVNVEEPLYEDGPRADTVENGAYIRIFKFDVGTKKCIAQFAYKLDRVAYTPKPATGFMVNGVPDILDLGNNKLLVMERSFSSGRIPCTIKFFIASLEGATDVSSIVLAGNNTFKPAAKELLLDLDALQIYTDNIEGFCFGPRLPNGNRTLIAVSDNNFSAAEITQLLVFEIQD